MNNNINNNKSNNNDNKKDNQNIIPTNSNLTPKIWGPPMWESMHMISFAYPNNPNDETKQKYKNYYQSLTNVLPCDTCRKEYSKLITNGPLELTDNLFKNRYTVTKWVYDLHEAVNKRLNVVSHVLYDDIVTKYEAARIHCTEKCSSDGMTGGGNKQKMYKLIKL